MATSQGTPAAAGHCRVDKADSALEPPREFSPVTLISNFWPPELGENTSLLFSATGGVAICYRSPRKLLRMYAYRSQRTCRGAQETRVTGGCCSLPAGVLCSLGAVCVSFWHRPTVVNPIASAHWAATCPLALNLRETDRAPRVLIN